MPSDIVQTIAKDAEALDPVITAINPIAGAAIEGAASVASGVDTAVTASEAAHATALSTATTAAQAFVTAAAPVVSSLPVSDQAAATAGMSLLQTVLADLKDIFKL